LERRAEEATIRAETAETERERAFSMLSAEGVPRERAKTIANGVDVLATRYRRDIQGAEAQLAALRAAVEELLKALEYVADKGHYGAHTAGVIDTAILNARAALDAGKGGDTDNPYLLHGDELKRAEDARKKS